VSRVRFAKRAREDLVDIWLHVAHGGSESVADRIVDRIEARCRQLKDHPRLGPERSDIGEGARSLLVERWLALYRLMPDGVQIVRILDGARDLRAIEWAPE
jgi:toxin ParE1/3/4